MKHITCKLNLLLSSESSLESYKFSAFVLRKKIFCLFQPTSAEIEKELPSKLPTKVANALKSNSVDANHKSVIVQKVVDNLYGKGMTSNKCLEKAARLMAARWSPLKVEGDDKHVSEN